MHSANLSVPLDGLTTMDVLSLDARSEIEKR